MRYWTGQLSAVINKTASRAILAVAANLVDKVNSTPPTASSSDQCEDIMDANQEKCSTFHGRYGIIGVKSRSYSI